MKTFTVHQHHHYGWTKNTYECETKEEAFALDVIKYHDFLKDYDADVTFDGNRYRVLHGDKINHNHFFAKKRRCLVFRQDASRERGRL